MNGALRKALWKTAILCTALSMFGVTVALAASGDLDGTFGSGGLQSQGLAGSLADRAWEASAQSGGRIIVVGTYYDYDNPGTTPGDFVVMGFTSGGTLDSTFDSDGYLTTDFGGFDVAWTVAVQSDDKVVAAGEKCVGSKCDVALARYNVDGGLDSSFSGDGMVTTDFASRDNGNEGGMAIQGDGKIVLAGYMKNSAGNYDMAVYRYNSDGTLDTSFSGDGRQSIGFGAGKQDAAWAVVLQGTKIVVAGETCSAKWTNCSFALARLTASGKLDSTFSGDGKQVTDFGASDKAYGIALQPDGKLVAAGERWVSGSKDKMAVARYKSNGALDTTFSGDGRQTVVLNGWSYANDVTIDGSGKIVLAGGAWNGATVDFAVARLNANGARDTGFSGDGISLGDFGADDYGRSVLVDGGGNYVVAGTKADYANAADFALLRMLP